MVNYPIHVPRLHYRGKDASKLAKVQRANLIARELEEAINELVGKQTHRFCSYDWGQFRWLGYSQDEIAGVGFRIDGGHNGFTVVRPELPET